MTAPDWTYGEVEGSPPLTTDQVRRVLAMMEVLRQPGNISQMAEIKAAIDNGEEGDLEMARALWDEFTQDEQQSLWVAPTYGGIFTTHERKVLRNQA